MKKIIHFSSLKKAMLGAVLCVVANVAYAQDTTTTITSAGTVREFSPDRITLTTEGSAPVSYSSTKTTTYVDENGNPVSVSVVKSGVPVTVFYSRDGDRMVAQRVVVKRSLNADGTMTKETTTTTTSSEGTVSSFKPDSIAVKTSAAEAPVNYTFTQTTTYVDENGNPVSTDVVKSGVPVTVFYDNQNGQMVATKVVVRGAMTPAPDGTVIEHKKTTTTTTTTEPNP